MSYLKDREIWLSNVPTGNPPAGYFWKFIQNGKVVVRDSSGNNQIMVATSGSQAITGSLTVTGGITGTVSSASYVEYSDVANKPALVSGSEQITYSGLTGIPSGIVSGSAQIASFGIFATTGSNGFNGSQSITGSLTVTGQVVAQTLNVQQVTSSIVYSSGSNVFGNSLANTQQFTGSVGVTGSLTVAGAGTFSNSVAVGTNITIGTSGTNNISWNTAGGIKLSRTNIGPEDTLTQRWTGALAYVDLAASSQWNGGVTILPNGGGNVGIGTTSPSTLLHVSGSSASIGRIVSTFALSSGYSDVVQILNPNQTGGGLSFNIGKAESTRNLGKIVYAHSSDGSTSNRLAFGFYDADNLLNLTAGGNVGIGTTSPSTFLHVFGSNTTDRGQLSIQSNNTSNAAKVTWYYHTTNQGEIGTTSGDFYALAVSNFLFYAGGSERMRITSGGNVLIGSTSGTTLNSLTNQLSVSSTTYNLFDISRFSNNAFGPNFYLVKSRNGSIGGNTIVENGDNLGNITWVAANGTGFTDAAAIKAEVDGVPGASNDMPGRLVFSTTADGAGSVTERMRITSGGLIGINTSSPFNFGSGSGMIDVRSQNTSAISGVFISNSDASARLTMYINSGATATIGTSTNHALQLVTNDVERMRITSGGNVGIGTSTINEKLDVEGNFVLRNSNTYSTSLTREIIYRSNTISYGIQPVANIVFATTGDAAGELRFITRADAFNYAERMRLSSGGTLYIGTATNPLSNATPLLGIVAGAATDAISIKHTQNGNNTLNIWQTGTSSFAALAFYKGDTQSERGNIIVTTSGTTYNSVSDYRLKENIVPIENGIDRLMQLKPSKFNWIETGNEAEGFIAHELQEIFPDAVTGEKDAVYSSTGNIKPQSVDYGRITPLLVKAIQEQQTLIESLKSRIEILEQ